MAQLPCILVGLKIISPYKSQIPRQTLGGPASSPSPQPAELRIWWNSLVPKWLGFPAHAGWSMGNFGLPAACPLERCLGRRLKKRVEDERFFFGGRLVVTVFVVLSYWLRWMGIILIIFIIIYLYIFYILVIIVFICQYPFVRVLHADLSTMQCCKSFLKDQCLTC